MQKRKDVFTRIYRIKDFLSLKNMWITLRVSTKAIKTINKNGITNTLRKWAVKGSI